MFDIDFVRLLGIMIAHVILLHVFVCIQYSKVTRYVLVYLFNDS